MEAKHHNGFVSRWNIKKPNMNISWILDPVKTNQSGDDFASNSVRHIQYSAKVLGRCEHLL